MEALMQAAEAQAWAMAHPRRQPVGLARSRWITANLLPEAVAICRRRSCGQGSSEIGAAGRQRMSAEDWAKLPPKVAEQLLESQREAMSPEFRQQINNYFRIIGERGRRNATPPAPKK